MFALSTFSKAMIYAKRCHIYCFRIAGKRTWYEGKTEGAPDFSSAIWFRRNWKECWGLGQGRQIVLWFCFLGDCFLLCNRQARGLRGVHCFCFEGEINYHQILLFLQSRSAVISSRLDSREEAGRLYGTKIYVCSMFSAAVFFACDERWVLLCMSFFLSLAV